MRRPFMNEKRIQTQNRIKQALLYLMQREKYENIQVKQITELAKVSRMAFYRNFSTKDDIVKCFIETQYNEFVEAISENNIQELESLLRVYCGYFYENRHILDAVVTAGVEGKVLKSQTAYFQKFFDTGITDIPEMPDYDVAYYSGAVFATLLYWRRKDYDIGVDAIAQHLISKFEQDL